MSHSQKCTVLWTYIYCSVETILKSSGYNLMLIHAADMNTDTLVMFWFIWLVCWSMGSACALQLGSGVFLWLRKVPGPVYVPNRLSVQCLKYFCSCYREKWSRNYIRNNISGWRRGINRIMVSFGAVWFQGLGACVTGVCGFWFGFVLFCFWPMRPSHTVHRFPLTSDFLIPFHFAGGHHWWTAVWNHILCHCSSVHNQGRWSS